MGVTSLTKVGVTSQALMSGTIISYPHPPFYHPHPPPYHPTPPLEPLITPLEPPITPTPLPWNLLDPLSQDTAGLTRGSDATKGNRNTLSVGFNLYDINLSILDAEPKEILSFSILSRRIWQDKQPKANEMGDTWNRTHKREALKLNAAQHTHNNKMVDLGTDLKADLNKHQLHFLNTKGTIISRLAMLPLCTPLLHI